MCCGLGPEPECRASIRTVYALFERENGLSPEQERFLTTAFDGARRDQAELRAAVEKLEKATAGNLDFGVNQSWQKIEERAARLVEKATDGLTKEQAVDRVLRTSEGRKLYASYTEEVEKRAATIAASEQATGLRYRREALEQRIADQVLKAAAAGGDADEALERELARPGVAQILGVDRREPVEKGSETWARIDRAAQRVMQAQPRLGPARAVALVLERDPSLYTAYLAELDAPDGAAAEDEEDPTAAGTGPPGGPVDAELRDRTLAEFGRDNRVQKSERPPNNRRSSTPFLGIS